MSINVLNSSAQLTGKTIGTLEADETVTGLKTFSRSTNPPFAVNVNAAKVSNLDADKLDGLDGTDYVKKDGTVAMTGTLDTGAIGQIKFPATQNPSANANTLDDYEEGTWTPALKFGGNAVGMTYSIQTGRYTKIGRLVVLECSITLTAKGSSTGAPTITGMPFNAGVTGATAVVDSPTGITGLTAGLYVVCDNAGNLYLFGNGVSGRNSITDTVFSNTSSLTFSMSYFV